MEQHENESAWGLRVLDACRRIESSESVCSLRELAGALDVDGSTLQRQFKKRLGVSPRGYARALRLNRLARGVGNAESALSGIFEAGFDSASTGYDASRRALGVTPGRLRGKLRIETWTGLSELGWMLMAATDRGICWLAFGDDPERLHDEFRAAFPKSGLQPGEARLRAWFDQVREFILLPERSLDMPVDVRGTAFQAGVWEALRRIPLGQTRSYSDVARSLGKPGAARAVASACAGNRIALLIPCHRVVAANGALSGYRWGVARKSALLARERDA